MTLVDSIVSVIRLDTNSNVHGVSLKLMLGMDSISGVERDLGDDMNVVGGAINKYRGSTESIRVCFRTGSVKLATAGDGDELISVDPMAGKQNVIFQGTFNIRVFGGGGSPVRFASQLAVLAGFAHGGISRQKLGQTKSFSIKVATSCQLLNQGEGGVSQYVM